MDLETIRAIDGCPVPKNVSEVRYFIGLVGYYRIFIEGFLNIIHPITSLKRRV
jgi:hypothetical protein